jgi:hypothetical protein
MKEILKIAGLLAALVIIGIIWVELYAKMM